MTRTLENKDIWRMARSKTGGDGHHYGAAHKDCFVVQGSMNVERQSIKVLKRRFTFYKAHVSRSVAFKVVNVSKAF